MTWVPRSASTHATRRAGPGPRGDKERACGAMDPGLRRDDDREGHRGDKNLHYPFFFLNIKNLSVWHSRKGVGISLLCHPVA